MNKGFARINNVRTSFVSSCGFWTVVKVCFGVGVELYPRIGLITCIVELLIRVLYVPCIEGLEFGIFEK